MGKKILNIVGDVILVLILLLAVAGIIYGLSTKTNGGVPKLFGKSAYAVPTNSMDITQKEAKKKGFTKTIHKGDVVFGDSNVSFGELEVGDIIFFAGNLINTDTNEYIIVHRIIDIGYDESGKRVYVITRGDNPEIPEDDVQTVTPAKYVAKYTGRIRGLGNAVLFLTNNTWIDYTNKDGTENAFLKGLHDFKLPIGFGVIIIIPIAIYLVIMIVRLVMVLNNNKKVDTANELAQGVVSDDVKDAIIQEYMRKQEELKRKQEEEALKAKENENKKE